MSTADAKSVVIAVMLVIFLSGLWLQNRALRRAGVPRKSEQRFLPPTVVAEAGRRVRAATPSVEPDLRAVELDIARRGALAGLIFPVIFVLMGLAALVVVVLPGSWWTRTLWVLIAASLFVLVPISVRNLARTREFVRLAEQSPPDPA